MIALFPAKALDGLWQVRSKAAEISSWCSLGLWAWCHLRFALPPPSPNSVLFYLTLMRIQNFWDVLRGKVNEAADF